MVNGDIPCCGAAWRYGKGSQVRIVRRRLYCASWVVRVEVGSHLDSGTWGWRRHERRGESTRKESFDVTICDSGFKSAFLEVERLGWL